MAPKPQSTRPAGTADQPTPPLLSQPAHALAMLLLAIFGSVGTGYLLAMAQGVAP